MLSIQGGPNLRDICDVNLCSVCVLEGENVGKILRHFKTVASSSVRNCAGAQALHEFTSRIKLSQFICATRS